MNRVAEEALRSPSLFAIVNLVSLSRWEKALHGNQMHRHTKFHEKDGSCGDTIFRRRGVFELEEKLHACIIRFCRPGALGALVHWYL